MDNKNLIKNIPIVSNMPEDGQTIAFNKNLHQWEYVTYIDTVLLGKPIITVPPPTNLQILRYNGTEWISSDR